MGRLILSAMVYIHHGRLHIILIGFFNPYNLIDLFMIEWTIEKTSIILSPTTGFFYLLLIQTISCLHIFHFCKWAQSRCFTSYSRLRAQRQRSFCFMIRMWNMATSTTEDVHCCCLRQFTKVGWSDKLSNLEVRKYVFGGNGSDTFSRRTKLCTLRWPGHVLRTEPHRLPHRTLFSIPQAGWKKRPGGQQVTWQCEMESATVGLRRVRSSRLPGWSPKDNSTRWLYTLKIYDNESWVVERFCHFLSGQFAWIWLVDRSDRNFCLLAKMAYFY